MESEAEYNISIPSGVFAWKDGHNFTVVSELAAYSTG